MKCSICGKEMIKLADGVNYGCDYCNIQTLLYRPNTGIPIDNSQRYIDMLNKERSELLVNSLAEKDKQITELQKQLEASETQNKRVLEKLELITKSNQDLEKQLEEKDKIIQMQQNIKRFDIGDILIENIRLRQKLNSQPAKIVKKIKNFCEIKRLDKETHEHKITLEQVEYYLDDLLWEYQKDKN